MAKTKEQIEQEIQQLAENMAKSTTDSKQLLFNTIMELGPEGLKKAAATLDDAGKELLKSCLDEMQKGKEDLTPKKDETKAQDMKTEGLSASDDEDEKLLMDEKNKEISHQGGPKDKPEGWQGEVIKAEPMGKKGEGSRGGKIIGHTASGKPVYEGAGHPSHEAFSHQDHQDASKAHLGISEKHYQDKSNSDYASVTGLQSLKSGKQFENAKSRYEESSRNHEGHRESAAYHRRMSDYKSGTQIGDLTPEDHKDQAQKHLKRAEKHLGFDQGDTSKPNVGRKETKDMSSEDHTKAQEAHSNLAESAKANGDKEIHQKNFVAAEKHKAAAEAKSNPESVKKSEDKEAVKKLIEIEEAEHNKDLNGDGKIAEKFEKDKEVKKALEEIVELAKSLNMTKEEVVKAIKEENEDLDKVKQSMASRMEKLKARKTDKPDETKQETPVEEPMEKPEMPMAVQKSVVWAPKNTLAANSLGRNTHYDVDAYIEKSEADKAETLKKGEYFGETQGEPLKKSEGQKADLNDIIEKGFDYSTDEIQRLEGIKNHKAEGRIVKSFHDEDIAAALGMSKEDYLKLMGE